MVHCYYLHYFQEIIIITHRFNEGKCKIIRNKLNATIGQYVFYMERCCTSSASKIENYNTSVTLIFINNKILGLDSSALNL